ncbi:hypothetical protein Tco_0169809 [Tanacetum coccineum]
MEAIKKEAHLLKVQWNEEVRLLEHGSEWTRHITSKSLGKYCGGDEYWRSFECKRKVDEQNSVKRKSRVAHWPRADARLAQESLFPFYGYWLSFVILSGNNAEAGGSASGQAQ